MYIYKTYVVCRMVPALTSRAAKGTFGVETSEIPAHGCDQIQGRAVNSH